MKTVIKDYFTFSKRDRRGIFWLLLIFILLIGYRVSQRWIPRFEQDYSKEITALIIELEERRDSVANAGVSNLSPAEYHRDQSQATQTNHALSDLPAQGGKREAVAPKSNSSFFFDPNTLEQSGWKTLGFTEKQIQTIENYKASGGKFIRKEDVGKLYCVSEFKYQELEPWILIPHNKLAVSGKLNLNTMDTVRLKKLKGIGSYYAKMIVEHRVALGGYHSYDQLNEIWKMRPETVQLLREHSFLDSSFIELLPINSATLDDLKAHPYFDWKLANEVVNYRAQHGQYNSWGDLDKLQQLTDENRIKLKPYIGFDD